MNKEELIRAIGELFLKKMQFGDCPTNGEVITALFPDAKKYESVEYHDLIFAPSCNLECCNEDWWSAPFEYKKVVEMIGEETTEEDE